MLWRSARRAWHAHAHRAVCVCAAWIGGAYVSRPRRGGVEPIVRGRLSGRRRDGRFVRVAQWAMCKWDGRFVRVGRRAMCKWDLFKAPVLRHTETMRVLVVGAGGVGAAFASIAQRRPA